MCDDRRICIGPKTPVTYRAVSGGKTRVWRVLAALVGAIVFFASSPFPEASALTSDEGALLSYTNSARASYGKAKLYTASDLNAVARQHSQEMAAKKAIYHNSSLPSDVHGWTKIGENVGRGPSAKSVHQAFMSSSSHRTHILDGAYNQIGIGAVWSGSGSSKMLYVTEIFVKRGSTKAPAVSPPKKKTVTYHYVPAVGPKPKPKAKPIPKPRPSPPRTLSVGILVQLLAMDVVPPEPAIDKPPIP